MMVPQAYRQRLFSLCDVKFHQFGSLSHLAPSLLSPQRALANVA
jgi:hypothetical protein